MEPARAVSRAPNRSVTVTASPGLEARARALAHTLGLPYENATALRADSLELRMTDAHLELRDPESGARLAVLFTPAELQRYRAGGGGPNPLRRAIGPAPRLVVDATAGLGRDAVHLAMLGYDVIAVERHPVVSALAQDGLARARAAGLLTHAGLTWHTEDAAALLGRLPARPETVYLDPMFPPKRKKSAAVRKEMQLVRALVADDADAAELLALARACASDRVVVKRADDAPPLAPAPTASYRGKLVRYDVYRTAS